MDIFRHWFCIDDQLGATRLAVELIRISFGVPDAPIVRHISLKHKAGFLSANCFGGEKTVEQVVAPLGNDLRLHKAGLVAQCLAHLVAD